MLSFNHKQFIASKVEEVLLSLSHPEIPKDKPLFILHITGAKNHYSTEVFPNWMLGIEKKKERKRAFKYRTKKALQFEVYNQDEPSLA